MKHLLIFAFVLTALIPLSAGATDAAVEASTTADVTVSHAGMLPDHPLYFLKSWKEKTQFLFTFGEERRAELATTLAEKRRAEYEQLTEKGKVELAERIKARFEEQSAKAEARLTILAEKHPEAAVRIRQMFERRQAVLEANLEKNPEQAREGIRRAIEAQVRTDRERMEYSASTTRPAGQRALLR